MDPVDKWSQRVLSTHIFNFIHGGTLMHWIQCKTKIQSSVIALKISNTVFISVIVWQKGIFCQTHMCESYSLA